MTVSTNTYATGRRKTATARVFLREGSGKITVNGRDFENYFPNEVLRMLVRQPLELTGTSGRFDVMATISGGGASGQAGALRHGISRALLEVDNGFRDRLKTEGLLTRDPREKERKKYGRAKARKRFQFSKR